MNFHIDDLDSDGAQRETARYARGALRCAIVVLAASAITGGFLGACSGNPGRCTTVTTTVLLDGGVVTGFVPCDLKGK